MVHNRTLIQYINGYREEVDTADVRWEEWGSQGTCLRARDGIPAAPECSSHQMPLKPSQACFVSVTVHPGCMYVERMWFVPFCGRSGRSRVEALGFDVHAWRAPIMPENAFRHRSRPAARGGTLCGNHPHFQRAWYSPRLSRH